MITNKKIETLKKLSKHSMNRIFEILNNSKIELKNGEIAWGQFLDKSQDDEQVGIYGTGAALEVLLLKELSEDDTLLKGAKLFLQNAFLKQQANLYNTKGDLSVLYKLSYMARSEKSTDEGIIENDSIYMEILKMNIEGRGWGDYYISSNKRDLHPNVLATSYALLALSNVQSFRGNPILNNSIKWLCERLEGNGNLRIYEIANSLLALEKYRDVGTNIDNFDRVIDLGIDRIIEWAKTREAKLHGTCMVHFFSSIVSNGESDRRMNRYLFFLSDCLVARALISWGKFNLPKKFIINIVEYYCKQLTLNERKFVPSTTGRAGTVDHMQIFRLLNSFNAIETNQLKPVNALTHTYKTSNIAIRSIFQIQLWISIILFSWAASLAQSGKDHFTFAMIGTVSAFLIILAGKLLTSKE